jgi:peptidoglycan/LPS O-acetylase OafA/YrhL
LIDGLRGLAGLAVVVTHAPRDHQGAIDAAFLQHYQWIWAKKPKTNDRASEAPGRQ